MLNIDLRSDTVTQPTDEMREAMARAVVGDDVYFEDPTVNRLQELAAAMFGKEDALFVPSGTMGNQICVKLHTQPGQEVVIEERGHIVNYEMSAMAVISGTIPRTVKGEAGLIDWETIERAIRPRGSYHYAATGLIALENTHNIAGGSVMPLEQMERIYDNAHSRGLPVHLDGARIFNASVAMKRSLVDLARPCDSIMFCLSKGLGAPVGSMIAGTREFIDRAKLVRKLLGGGMRQVGVLAAAGLVALEKMIDRLEEDHDNARFLARGLAGIRGICIDPERVQTNILIFDISETGKGTSELAAVLKDLGVLANGINAREMRMVTHKDVSRAECERALDCVRAAVET